MIKILILCNLLLGVYEISAQLSVPFNSLPTNATFSIKKEGNTEGVLYASTYTDTINRYRLWVFYDTSNVNIPIKSILIEFFNKGGLLESQFFVSDKKSILKPTWETSDFLNLCYGDSDSSYLSFCKGIIQKSFLFKQIEITKYFKNETAGAIRSCRFSLTQSWEYALQVPPKNKDFAYLDWDLITAYDKQFDSIRIVQMWKIGYEQYKLNRIILNGRLNSMNINYETESLSRHFEYNKKGLLHRIIDTIEQNGQAKKIINIDVHETKE